MEKINNRGQVVGSYVDVSGNNHGFVYDSVKAQYYTIDDPTMAATSLDGIDDNETLVGDFRRMAGGGRVGLRATGSLP